MPFTDFVSEFIKDKLWPRRRVAAKTEIRAPLDPPHGMTNTSCSTMQRCVLDLVSSEQHIFRSALLLLPWTTSLGQLVLEVFLGMDLAGSRATTTCITNQGG